MMHAPTATIDPPVAQLWRQGRLHFLVMLVTSRWVVYGFTDVALVAVLRQAGATLPQISLLMGVGFLFLFKFLWAPLVDRYRIGRSQYRGWLLASQTVMALQLGCLLLFDPKTDLYPILAFLAAGSLAATFRDIAMDGLSVKLLSEPERAEANGWMSAGFMAGIVIGGGFVLLLYDRIGWTGSVLVLVAATALPLPWIALFKEPEGARAAATRFWPTLVAFFQQPGHKAWAGMVILLASVGVVANGLVPVILIDLKWSLAQVGTISNIVAPLIGLGASLLAGFAFRHVSRRAALAAACVLGALTGLALIPLSTGGYSFSFASTVVIASIVAGVILNIAAKAVIMDKSAATPAQAATSYTVQASLSQIGGIGVSSLAPLLAEAWGYPAVMGISAGLGVLAAVTVLRFKSL